MSWWLIALFIVGFLILAYNVGFGTACALSVTAMFLWFAVPAIWGGAGTLLGGSLDAVAAFFLAFAFLFSGAWIWLWFGMYLLLGSCFWYDDKIPNGAILTIGATVLWFVLWPHSWGTFREHMFQLFVYAIPSYLGLGVIWSFYKWRMTLKDLHEQITEAIANMKQAKAAWEVDKKKPEREQEYTIRNKGTRDLFDWLGAYPAGVLLTKEQVDKDDFIPSIKKGKGKNKITNWILFWPWSVFNYVFGKLLHDLLNFIVDSFSKVYNSMSHAILGDLKGLSQKS